MNDNIKAIEITISISKEAAEAIQMINDRYYFDLFKEIRTSEDEEYQFRDAIIEIAKQIKKRG